MKIYIAADHAGFYLKKQLIQYLELKGYEVEDMGADELDPDDDYPDFIIPCALRVAKSHAQGKLDDVGVVIGGSGQGEAIAANKVKGIRAAVYYGSPSTHSTSHSTLRDKPSGSDSKSSVQASSGSLIPRLAKEHNDANVLSLGARFVSPDDAKKAITTWLDAKFEGGRHVKRLDKISRLESR